MSTPRDEATAMTLAYRSAAPYSAWRCYGVLLLCLLLGPGIALAQANTSPAIGATSSATLEAQNGQHDHRGDSPVARPAATGQGDGHDGVERPVYLDIVPVAGAQDTTLPADVIAAMAGETLSGLQQAVIRMDGQALPAGVRVLRIMYIVHEQPDASGTTLAASASTELLRTAANKDGQILTYSLYNGLQQTLVQGPVEDSAVGNLRAHFKQELQRRIASAFNGTAAR